MRTKYLVGLVVGMMLVVSGIKPTTASQVSKSAGQAIEGVKNFLTGRDITEVMPDGPLVVDYNGDVVNGGTVYVPGGKLNFSIAIHDLMVRGVPYTLLIIPPGDTGNSLEIEELSAESGWSTKTLTMERTGLFTNSFLLETVTKKQIEKRRDRKAGGLFSQKYRVVAEPGTYVIALALDTYRESKKNILIHSITFGHPSQETKKVVRRVTEYGEDENGNRIVAQPATEAEQPQFVPAAQDPTPPTTKRRHRTRQAEDQEVTTTVTPKVTSGVVDVFCPAGMTISATVYDQSGSKVDDTGNGVVIGANGKVRVNGIKPLPATVVVHYWAPSGWVKVGEMSLDSANWFGSTSLKIEDRTWLTQLEMDRYLYVCATLDKKQGTNIVGITRQRIATGDWLYWVQKPHDLTAEERQYIASVKDPRRWQQLRDMLSANVIHTGPSAFPSGRVLTAGETYELVYQVWTAQDKQWAIRDGAAFQRTYGMPTTPPSTCEVTTKLHRPAVVTPPCQPQPRPRPQQPFTRVVEEEITVEGYASGEVNFKTLGGSVKTTRHTKGLLDYALQPLSAYLGRTKVSITTTSGVGNVTGGGATIGDVNAEANSDSNSEANSDANADAYSEAPDINIDVDAAASAAAAADAAAASESH